MNDAILNTNSQLFIDENINEDITKLLLKKHPNLEVDIKLLIAQIEAKKRCDKKLPTWYNTPQIYYPNKLNIAQTSSEITAKYKASLITGNSLIDITGGFGVDAYYFGKQFKTVTHCEIDQTLSEIVKHNYQQLAASHIKTINNDGIAYLKTTDTTYDYIYIDPSRRHDSKGKVFLLKDCLPNVPEVLSTLFSRANNILIKTAPLLDISMGISELKHVKTIHVVAVNNEVKELLWLLEKDYNGSINIKTCNLKKQGDTHFNFQLNVEALAKVSYSLPLAYIYEPNAAILKAGAFNSIAEQLGVHKLQQHTHLYTTDQLIDFPGRRFKITHTLPYNKKQFKALGISKANITTRNFPESVQDIRNKLGIKDGGTTYLFFTTNMNDTRMILVCDKLD